MGWEFLKIEYLPCAEDEEEVLRAMAPALFLSSFLVHCSPFPEKQNWFFRLLKNQTGLNSVVFMICWECRDMKSYFNPKQRIRMKKKIGLFESLWGSELGIVLQKFSISDTNSTQQYVARGGWERLQEAWRNNTAFYSEACGQVLGRESCLDLVPITLPGRTLVATEFPRVYLQYLLS